MGDGNGLGRTRGLGARACVFRAGVAARARLTVALACRLADLLPFLLDLRVLTLRFRVLGAAGRFRADFTDRLAALLGRFVFTPPPCRFRREPNLQQNLSKPPSRCAKVFLGEGRHGPLHFGYRRYK